MSDFLGGMWCLWAFLLLVTTIMSLRVRVLVGQPHRAVWTTLSYFGRLVFTLILMGVLYSWLPRVAPIVTLIGLAVGVFSQAFSIVGLRTALADYRARLTTEQVLVAQRAVQDEIARRAANAG
jgi:hypothetical protein